MSDHKPEHICREEMVSRGRLVGIWFSAGMVLGVAAGVAGAMVMLP